MRLAIDIGNTQTKAQLFGPDGPSGDVIIGSSDSGYICSLLQRFQHVPIVIASVRSLDEQLTAQLEQQGVLLVSSHTPLPIANLYHSPETLGTDRICAAIGAKVHFPDRPVLAIDMGTCITYEVVTARGEYLGGGISPGLRMRFKALNMLTDRLPLVEPAMDVPVIGTDTESCIRSGVQQGIIMEVDGLMEHHLRSLPELVTVGTGGDFPFFAGAFKRPIFADPILVLRGLHEILLHNS